MRIEINRLALLEELNKVNKIMSPKPALTVLGGILMNVKKEGLFLTGSDGSTSISTFIEEGKYLKINAIGVILIRNRFFIELIKKIDDKNIVISSEEGNIKIAGVKFSSKMNVMEAKDYPNIVFQKTGNKFKFNVAKFKEAISQTSFAIGEKDKRLVLTGLNIQIKSKEICFKATDSYRLAKKVITGVDENNDTEADLIVPGKFISEIDKLISDSDEMVEMTLTNSNISFSIKNVIIQSKVIEGKYPDTSKVIPDEFLTIIKINSRELIKTIERVSVLATDQMGVIINLKTENKNLSLTSHAYEIGDAEEKITDINIQGPDQTIAFNARYLIDALRSFHTDEVLIKLNSDSKPIVITSDELPSLTQLILPVRII